MAGDCHSATVFHLSFELFCARISAVGAARQHALALNVPPQHHAKLKLAYGIAFSICLCASKRFLGVYVSMESCTSLPLKKKVQKDLKMDFCVCDERKLNITAVSCS